jgi:AcrR family transcriptional regulator
LRDELLAAADEILERSGDPGQVSVRGVAGAVGVAPNAVYLHFADRDTLLAEVAIRHFEDCGAAVRAAGAVHAEPLEALYAGCETYCRLALERPGHYRLLFHGLVRPADRAVATRLAKAARGYFQTCIDACQAAIDAGALAPTDARQLAAAMWAVEHGWCEIRLTGDLGEGLLPPARDTLSALLNARA